MKIKRIMNKLTALIIVITMLGLTCNTGGVHASNKGSENFTYYGDGFAVNFTIVDSWAGALNAKVSITNTGTEDIDNWAIEFPYQQDITTIWNGTIEEKSEDTYLIKNVGSNQDILVGTTIEFGFTSERNGEITIPKEYSLKCFNNKITDIQVDITYNTVSTYNEGFSAEFLIKNISDRTIEDWTLGFEFDGEINTIWGANIVEQVEGYYYIKNNEYNQNIYPGETIKVGFNGRYQNDEKVSDPFNIAIYQINLFL